MLCREWRTFSAPSASRAGEKHKQHATLRSSAGFHVNWIKRDCYFFQATHKHTSLIIRFGFVKVTRGITSSRVRDSVSGLAHQQWTQNSAMGQLKITVKTTNNKASNSGTQQHVNLLPKSSISKSVSSSPHTANQCIVWWCEGIVSGEKPRDSVYIIKYRDTWNEFLLPRVNEIMAQNLSRFISKWKSWHFLFIHRSHRV